MQDMTFPFNERVNEIVKWVRTAALYDKCKCYEVAILESWYKNGVTETAKYFLLPVFIVYGYIGIIVLITEIMCKKNINWKRFWRKQLRLKYEFGVFCRTYFRLLFRKRWVSSKQTRSTLIY